ncbi:MAG: ABC transporter substrate-binding protein [Nitrospinae bacterium]|nr:ABC transporter substrate-binding protein [Nitrospinota bacterium]
MSITLLENFRAVFYTPFYAAFSAGAFVEEGVDVRIETSPDPARNAELLMSGEAQVSWGGPMRVLVAYDKNPYCNLKVFCEVVCRDPFFLIGREPNPAFRMGDLVGPKVATVSEVPTPWMCLQHDLQLAGLDPQALDRVPDKTMDENAEALRAGAVDVVQVFQPFAEELILEGAGHIWYQAAERGLTTYTAFYAPGSFLRDHPESALGMTRAMAKTELWLADNDAEAVTELVKPWFEDMDSYILMDAIERYKSLGLWNRNPRLAKESFNWLRAACLSGGLITTGVSYEKAVDMRFVDNVWRRGGFSDFG